MFLKMWSKPQGWPAGVFSFVELGLISLLGINIFCLFSLSLCEPLLVPSSVNQIARPILTILGCMKEKVGLVNYVLSIIHHPALILLSLSSTRLLWTYGHRYMPINSKCKEINQV